MSAIIIDLTYWRAIRELELAATAAQAIAERNKERSAAQKAETQRRIAYIESMLDAIERDMDGRDVQHTGRGAG